MNFRNLRADEIECRVGQISEKGFTLLLYKDARCDMRILDETVGPERWQKSFSEENGIVSAGVRELELCLSSDGEYIITGREVIRHQVKNGIFMTSFEIDGSRRRLYASSMAVRICSASAALGYFLS